MWALERALRRLHLRARCRWRCNARGCNGKSYDLSTRVRTRTRERSTGKPERGDNTIHTNTKRDAKYSRTTRVALARMQIPGSHADADYQL